MGKMIRLKRLLVIGAALLGGRASQAAILPVTSGQCQLQVLDSGVDFRAPLKVQTRKACLFICDPRELGEKYLAVWNWKHPVSGMSYLASVKPRQEEGRLEIAIHVERQNPSNLPDPGRLARSIELQRSLDGVWTAADTEGRGYSPKGTPSRVALDIPLAADVLFRLTCATPY